MDRKRSNAVTACCALVVLAALVFSAPRKPRNEAVREETTARVQPTDAIQAFRQEREDVRRLETLQLNAVAADEGAEENVRSAARRELIRRASAMEAESTIEGILRIRGFADAVATVHEESVNVIVRASSLTQAESAQILELVMRETGKTGGEIKIMTVD